MKKIKNPIRQLFLVTALFLFSTGVFAQATWKADPPHAKITFSTLHNTIADIQGNFNSFESTIKASKEDFSDAVFDLTIDVASIDTEIKMRDDHQR